MDITKESSFMNFWNVVIRKIDFIGDLVKADIEIIKS